MKRIRLKKKIKIKNSIVILFLLFISLLMAFKFINSKVNPILLDYANMEARKLSSIIINDAISKNFKSINVDDLFIITKEGSEIKSLDFNPIIVNQVLTNTTTLIQTNLKYLEQGKIELLNLNTDALIDYNTDKLRQGIIYEIPSGVIFGNSFLANIGPKIPVRFSIVGDIISYVNSNVKDYGINNALIEVNVVLELSIQVILPFVTDKISIETSIPVALKLIQGNVPNYYLNGIQNSPSIAVPFN